MDENEAAPTENGARKPAAPVSKSVGTAVFPRADQPAHDRNDDESGEPGPAEAICHVIEVESGLD